jgi:hypothetical protein
MLCQRPVWSDLQPDKLSLNAPLVWASVLVRYRLTFRSKVCSQPGSKGGDVDIWFRWHRGLRQPSPRRRPYVGKERQPANRSHAGRKVIPPRTTNSYRIEAANRADICVMTDPQTRSHSNEYRAATTRKGVTMRITIKTWTRNRSSTRMAKLSLGPCTKSAMTPLAISMALP